MHISAIGGQITSFVGLPSAGCAKGKSYHLAERASVVILQLETARKCRLGSKGKYGFNRSDFVF